MIKRTNKTTNDLCLYNLRILWVVKAVKLCRVYNRTVAFLEGDLIKMFVKEVVFVNQGNNILTSQNNRNYK